MTAFHLQIQSDIWIFTPNDDYRLFYRNLGCFDKKTLCDALALTLLFNLLYSLFGGSLLSCSFSLAL
ncbi:hypothetical protein D0T50_12910 [Bacteroides sp. 214]|nr:hypothetical protein [Bacteroides sp. 214]